MRKTLSDLASEERAPKRFADGNLTQPEPKGPPYCDRPEFLQKGTLVAGIAGSQNLVATPLASENHVAKTATAKASAAASELSAEEDLCRTKTEPDLWAGPMPDAQGGIPTNIMEMLAYSRPGVIEVLPALSQSLVKGSIDGMLLRTFAVLSKLTWDMETRIVDLTVTSLRKQDVRLIARYGIEWISASAGVLASSFRSGCADCELHLPEGKPVNIRLKLGSSKPIEWVKQD